MEVVESVFGKGRLYGRHQEIGEVTYDLIVFRQGEVRGVSGRISCPIACLAKAHRAGKATLHLVDGRKLKVRIKRVDFRVQTADFEAAGWFF
jgi:hypothetical protein